MCVGCACVCACVCVWLSTLSLRSSEQRSARRLRQALMPADREGSSVAVRMSSSSVMNLGCEGTHLREGGRLGDGAVRALMSSSSVMNCAENHLRGGRRWRRG